MSVVRPWLARLPLRGAVPLAIPRLGVVLWISIVVVATARQQLQHWFPAYSHSMVLNLTALWLAGFIGRSLNDHLRGNV